MSICSQFYLVYSIFFAISCVKTNKLPFCQIISIYALLAEGDLLEGYGNDNPGAFQSTPSSRRATNQDKLYNLINPISIHALLTEGDRLIDRFRESVDRFQSTPSSRRATQPIRHITTLQIHFNPRPPHGGRQRVLYHFSAKGHFNPRPPHGGRHAL